MILKSLTHNSTLAENEPDWGSVDKTKLPRNAFADMGDANKKSTWKYPHHWVKNGEVGEDGIYTSGDMYLHKGGLIAAWQAANGARSGQEASDSVKAHLMAHRKAIGLDNDKSYEPIILSYHSLEKEFSDEDKVIVHYITTEDIDWIGDVVIAKGMDASEFEKYKTVFYNHDTEKPIAKNIGLIVKDGKGVIAKSKFSEYYEFSNDIYNLYKEDIINTWSIRFRPKNTSQSIEFKTNEKGEEITIYKNWDLIEYSAAPLAMNPNAVTLAKSIVKSDNAKYILESYEKYFTVEKAIKEHEDKLKQINELLEELKSMDNINEKLNELENAVNEIKNYLFNSNSVIQNIVNEYNKRAQPSIQSLILEIAKKYKSVSK